MSSHTALPVEPLDVLIMGAGVSGIGAAAYLRRNQPNKTFAILESRERMGVPGTCSDTPASAPTRTSTPSVSTSSPGPRPSPWRTPRIFLST